MKIDYGVRILVHLAALPEDSIAKVGLDFDTIFKNTNTSYEPDELGRASGKTGADIERIEAFIKLGRKDPVAYQTSWEELTNNNKS